MANQRVYQILVYRHELFKINFTGVPSSFFPVSPRFFPLFRLLSFSLVLHYLNAWNRLHQTLRANEEEEEEEVDEEDDDIPPIHMFFDIKAMQPQEQHVANLDVAESEDDDRSFCFREHSLRDFLE